MRKLKRVGITSLMICLPIILIIVFNINESNGETKTVNGNNTSQEPTLRGEDTETHPKLNWAVDMLKEDILYETGFEDGDMLPLLKYGSSNIHLPENRKYGGQEYVTDEKYSGKRSLKVTDSYNNGNMFTENLDGTLRITSDYSWNDFRNNRFYMENGTNLSLSFRSKATGKVEVRFEGNGGIADFGTPMDVTFEQDVKDGDRTVKVSDVEIFKKYIEDNIKFYLANQKGEYKYIYVESVDEKEKTITMSSPFRGEFKKGDNVLKHVNRTPVSFPVRYMEKTNEWELYSVNTKVKDYTDFNTLKNGFYLLTKTRTHDTLYIDDLKVGYATKTKLYRDNKQVYEGYLSDYEDKQAKDTATPDKVSDYTLQGTKDNKNYINLKEPKDNGTTYKYRLDAVSKEGNVYPSKELLITVKSGIKGYSYTIDNSEKTVPNATVNNTNGKIELDKTKGEYLHVRTVDKEGNASETVTYKVQDLINEIPTIEFQDVPNGWINVGFYYKVEGKAYKGNNVARILDNEGKEIESPYRETINKNGDYRHTIYDNKGNSNERILSVWNIDKTNPKLTIKQNNTDWTNKNITLTATGHDEDSGIEGVRLSKGSPSNNIVSIKDIRGYNLTEYKFEKDKLILIDNKGASTSGVYIPYTKIEPNKEYVLSYDIKKLDGDVDRLGGHLQVSKRAEYYIDGIKQENGQENPYTGSGDLGNINDGKVHHITVKFKADNWEVSNRNIYIQPNRKISKPYQTEIRNIQLEEGTEETTYTPNSADLPTNENPMEIEVENNGLYEFNATDKAGNEQREEINITNIDKTPPEISITPSTPKPTNKNVLLNVTSKDSGSGVKSTKYLGENMVKNGDFSEGDSYWNTNVGSGGEARIENGTAILDDNSTSLNKISQKDAFKGTVEGASYYAEVLAKGEGILNARYGVYLGRGQDNYKQEITSKDEYRIYRFKLNRNEDSTDSFMLEKVGKGKIEIKDVKVFAEKGMKDGQLEVTENGTYEFISEDNAGNIAKQSYKVDNIDKTPPTINVTQNTDEITHEDVTLNIDVEDKGSGLKKVKNLGNNVVKNGDFGDESMDWKVQVGEVEISKGLLEFKGTGSLDKIYQPNIFIEDSEDSTYYAEVIAKGEGTLNVRYGRRGSTEPDEDYKQKLEDKNEYKLYRFRLERYSNSNNNLILEKLGAGNIKVKEIKVFSEKDVTDKTFTVKENGTYTFVAEDNAGNISTKTHEVTNIDKGIRLTAPNELNLGTSKIGNKVQGKLSNVFIEDWREDGNNWKVQVEASPLQNKDTKETLEKGTIQLDGNVTSTKLEGKGDIPVQSYEGYVEIDTGKVDILQGKNSRGKYSMEFGTKSLKVNIDPTTIKTGEYESKLTWDLVQAP